MTQDLTTPTTSLPFPFNQQTFCRYEPVNQSIDEARVLVIDNLLRDERDLSDVAREEWGGMLAAEMRRERLIAGMAVENILNKAAKIYLTRCFVVCRISGTRVPGPASSISARILAISRPRSLPLNRVLSARASCSTSKNILYHDDSNSSAKCEIFVMSYGTATALHPIRAKTDRYLAVAKSGQRSRFRPTFSSTPSSVCWISTRAAGFAPSNS
jgi:hypothetical protein